MPPGRPWAYGNMSMRNPMSRAPMNNNPMGNQASMQPNFGRAIGAIGATSLPYAGGGLGMAGPAGAAQGMSAVRPAPVRQKPQGNFYSRAMAGDPIYGQNGIGVQRAAQNVLMGQPMGADTRMRPLNIPGMQFDPNRNAMVRQQRPVMNPGEVVDRTKISGLAPISDKRREQLTNTRIARAGRLAGVRPQDMAQWRERSPAAIAMRNRVANTQMAAGPSSGTPARMGDGGQTPAANTLAGAPAVTPPAVPPANQPVQVAMAQQESPEARYRRERDAQYFQESQAIQNTPGMPLGEQVYRTAALGINKTLSGVRDGYTNLVQGVPKQAQWQYIDSNEENQFWRRQNLRQRIRAGLAQARQQPQSWADVIYRDTTPRMYPGD